MSKVSPLTLRQDEDFANCEDAVNETKLAIQRRDAEIEALQSSIAVDQFTGEARLIRERGVLDKAAAITRGEHVDLTVASVRERINALRQERNALVEALPLLQRQLGQARQKASREICKRLQPKYEALLKRMAKAAKEISEAQADWQQFINELDMADVMWLESFRPLGASWANRPRNGGQSNVEMFSKELDEATATLQ